MNQKKLGNTPLQVAPIIFGGNIFGWTVDEATSFRLIDSFVAKGFNMIDTADVYSRWAPGNHGGESETIIGKWMKQSGNRDKVLITTKGGADSGHGPDVTKKNILESAERSLQRLQTDHIDLYYTHFDNENTPVEEALSAYDKLVRSGKVRFIGASNMSKQRIGESLKLSREKGYPAYASLQPLYNLYDREKFEAEYLELALDNGLGVTPYFALASGFLTGKYRSRDDFGKSARGGGMEKYLNHKGLAILEVLDQVSAAHGATPAQVSLAWVIAQPSITAAIASATSEKQLADFTRAVELDLSEKDLDALNSVVRNMVHE